MPKVITFGEIMLRLSTPGYLRFGQARQFDATFGGGEANELQSPLRVEKSLVCYV